MLFLAAMFDWLSPKRTSLEGHGPPEVGLSWVASDGHYTTTSDALVLYYMSLKTMPTMPRIDQYHR